MEDKNKQYNIPQPGKKYMDEQEVRELIAASLANWTGVTRFRTIESVVTTIADFTNAQHTHANAAGGGQITDTALSSVVTVPKGGTGVNTLASGSLVVGAGAGAVTTLAGKTGTFSFYVAATSAGPVTTKVDCDRGVIIAVT